MSISQPHSEADLPIWRESVTNLVNDLPDHVKGRKTTINGTPLVIKTLPIPAGAVYVFDWTAVARQTEGSGTIGDGAAYAGLVAFHLVGGTATVIGSAASLLAVEDNGAWGVAVTGTGNQAEWTVTGEASKTIGWRIDMDVRKLSL